MTIIMRLLRQRWGYCWIVVLGVAIFVLILQQMGLLLKFHNHHETDYDILITTTANDIVSSVTTTTTSSSTVTKTTTTMMIDSKTTQPFKPKKYQRNDFITTTTTRYQRIYCIVPFLWQPPKSTARYEEIMNTWGKRCDYIRFMIDPIIGSYESGWFTDVRTNATARATLPDNIRVINMTRPWNKDCPFVNIVQQMNDTKTLHGGDNYLDGKVCRHLWEKMWRTWTYIYYNEIHLADWFVKIDWDSYFFPNNLRHYINAKQYTPQQQHFIGHTLYHRIKNYNLTMIAGAIEVLSSQTIYDIVPYLERMTTASHNLQSRYGCYDRPSDGEDVSIAWCLKQHLQLEPESARSKIFGCDYVALQNFNDYVLYNRTEQGEWWFWKGKPSNIQYGCLADHPIGFHEYKRLGSLYEVEDAFYSKNTIIDNKTRHIFTPSANSLYKKYMGNDKNSVLYIKLNSRHRPNQRAIDYIFRVRNQIAIEDPINIKRQEQQLESESKQQTEEGSNF